MNLQHKGNRTSKWRRAGKKDFGGKCAPQVVVKRALRLAFSLLTRKIDSQLRDKEDFMHVKAKGLLAAVDSLEQYVLGLQMVWIKSSHRCSALVMRHEGTCSKNKKRACLHACSIVICTVDTDMALRSPGFARTYLGT